MLSTTRARAYGARLFAGYAVASLLPIVLLGAVLAHGNQGDGQKRGLQQGLAQAAVIEEMAIAPALRGVDLTAGLTRREEQRLQAATDLAIYRGSVTRLRLRSFDGATVFSDDGTVAGAIPTTDAAFLAAAAGIPQAAIEEGSQGSGSVIRVTHPVIANATGRAVGVLELYLPYDSVAAQIEESTRRTYWRLGAGLAGLYLILALMSWSSSRRLRRHAAQREHEALHDSLTGLPNRELFRHRLEEMTRRQVAGAVVLVDLDRFKEVNDSLGHHAGDDLLLQVGHRLQDTLRTDDTMARLGGDEFGLVLPNVPDARTAYDLVARARAQLAAEFVVDGVPLNIEASFGIARYPADAKDSESLLRCADAAMYQGKRGTNGIVVFDDALAVTRSHSLSVQTEIRRAIDQGELRLHYQPQVDLATGEVTAVEALVRWQHPERGLLPPGEFLAAVEPTSLIDPLTDWVLHRALADCRAWTAAGNPWAVAVNVSARNLESTDFARRVQLALKNAAIPPSRLQVEVTETALAVDLATVGITLERLASLGVGIAIDDFGVGYASLAHLRQLALSEVKIDRGFISAIGDSERDRELVTSLVQLAHGLGLRVTAEGVESGATVAWLRTVGCDSAQGFHFARPAPWSALAEKSEGTSSTQSLSMEAPV